MLNKDKKARVMLSICNVNIDDVFSHVKEQSVVRDTSHKTVLKKVLDMSTKFSTDGN